MNRSNALWILGALLTTTGVSPIALADPDDSRGRNMIEPVNKASQVEVMREIASPTDLLPAFPNPKSGKELLLNLFNAIKSNALIKPEFFSVEILAATINAADKNHTEPGQRTSIFPGPDSSVSVSGNIPADSHPITLENGEVFIWKNTFAGGFRKTPEGKSRGSLNIGSPVGKISFEEFESVFGKNWSFGRSRPHPPPPPTGPHGNYSITYDFGDARYNKRVNASFYGDGSLRGVLSTVEEK